MTRLARACLAFAALLLRHAVCWHPARTTRPSGLVGPGGKELLTVACPHCRTHWTEYPK